MTTSFHDVGIDISASATGPEVATTCPQCSPTRKKSKERCLSVNIEKKCWKCNHCGWTGGLSDPDTYRRPAKKPEYKRPDPRPSLNLPQNVVDWFHERGISDAVVLRNRLDFGQTYMPQLEAKAETVIFPYFRGGELVNRKYRTIQEKHFRMEAGCELILYGLDDIDPEKPLVWVEGECDKLAVETAGIRQCVSVPNGAPPANAKNYDALLSYLEADQEKLSAIETHVIAVDSDAPGNALETELARRLGIEKCLRVSWPEGCKDANEVLVKHGAEELLWYLNNAAPFPIESVVSVDDCHEDVMKLYESGLEPGASTGWAALDKYYTVRPGEFTAISGIPSSGKSNFLDCLLVNLARIHGWRFALFSPENLPVKQHIAAIAEKAARKPFHRGPNLRISPEELVNALSWTNDHFTWILPDDEEDWTIEKILTAGTQLCMRRGIRGLVIDPWNELEAQRPPDKSETEYISQTLKRIRVFARQRAIHVWVVVHPQKLYRDKDGNYPVPTLYDCAGSAHWRNKADNGIIVWRDLNEDDSSEVDICIQKIRFRHIGRRGVAKLYYEPICATYRDSEKPQMNFSDRSLQ